MASLTYSSSALNTLSKFHRKKFVVFVEGIDDIHFWNILFSKYGFTNILIKPAGGVTEINKYANFIVNDNAKIVVARDCDYSDLLKTQLKHPRVIYTYGYSLENTLYCAEAIANVIAVYARKVKNYKKDVSEWLNEFAEKIRELLEFDLANEIHGKGIQVMGSNCCRFLKSNSSHISEETKIKTFIKSIEGNFTNGEIADAGNRIKKSAKSIFYVIRGHFLTNAVINFIKHKVHTESGKDVTFSPENLFTHLLLNFEAKCMKNKDVKFIENQISNLKVSLGI